MMDPSIQDLIDISHYAARHPDWVQGGGGNCSVKSGARMIIKASGFFLEEVTADHGFVFMDLKSEKPEGSLRPSMEYPLHLLLNRFVIHTHPAPLGALVCSAEGREAFRQHFPEKHFFWIPYATPGRKLFEKVRETLAGAAAGSGPRVLFLENHGLFAAAETKDETRRLHEEAIRRCEQLLPAGESDSLGLAHQYLTPDHAVYDHMDRTKLSEKQRLCQQELDAFSRDVLGRIRAKGWTPRFLELGAVAELLGMEEERYRRELWKPKP